MHGRGEVFAAAVTLASGLKRAPEHEDALDWFLSIYLEELPNPGLERELLQVLQRQADGHSRFGVLLAELEHLERYDKIEALQLAMERHRIVLPDGRAAGPPVDTEPLPESGPAADHDESVERWDRFESPLTGRTDAVAGPNDEAAGPEDGPDVEVVPRKPETAPDATTTAEEDEPRVRYVEPEEVDASGRQQAVPQALLLGIALILAAAAMVWIAFSQTPVAPTEPFEPAGSGVEP